MSDFAPIPSPCPSIVSRVADELARSCEDLERGALPSGNASVDVAVRRHLALVRAAVGRLRDEAWRPGDPVADAEIAF